VIEEKDLAQSIAISNTNDDTIRFFINNTISTPEVKQALQKAVEFKAALAKVQQDLGNVNQQLKVITDDQGRLRANLREMPQTATAYKRYLEKFDKQETEIEDLQKQQKSLQTKELEARQALDGYLTSLNVK
jgi:chromosome segregation ATPase